MTRLQMISAILRLKTISATEMLVLVNLASHASKTSVAQISQAQMANSLPISLSAVERSLRALSHDGYLAREQKFHKVTGHRIVDKIKITCVKRSFVEPSSKLRAKVRLTGCPPVTVTGHYIYKKLPSGSDANFVAQTDLEKNPANELKLIVGGKS